METVYNPIQLPEGFGGGGGVPQWIVFVVLGSALLLFAIFAFWPHKGWFGLRTRAVEPSRLLDTLDLGCLVPGEVYRLSRSQLVWWRGTFSSELQGSEPVLELGTRDELAVHVAAFGFERPVIVTNTLRAALVAETPCHNIGRPWPRTVISTPALRIEVAVGGAGDIPS
ncbi:MAG: hypothetical protein AAFR79_09265 [Pseudomonadota bacterium]